MSGNDVILSFHDSLIKNSDINILEGPEWLNDRIIGFFFQYLDKMEYVRFERHATFVSPEVTQCIKLGPRNDVKIFIEPLNLHKKNLILLPVNDCMEEESPGGSHWSLLVYVRENNTFYHLDSFNNSNNDHAREIMKRISPFIRTGYAIPQFIPLQCLQQDNSYDCGIHVICNSEFICRKYLNGDNVDLFSFVTIERINGKRLWLRDLIFNLKGRK